jgi:hypothetical protein
MLKARDVSSPNRKPDSVALCLLLVAAALLLGNLAQVENITGDSARYMGLADSLYESGDYEFNFRRHTRFPPGFPALLGAIPSHEGQTYAPKLKSVALQAVLALLAAYLVLRNSGRPWLGVLCLILLISSPYFFERVTRHVASEFAYMLCSFAALLLFQLLARGSLRHLAPLSAALAVCVFFSVMLRSVAIALFAPLALGLAIPVFRRRLGRGTRALWAGLLAGASAQLAWIGWQRGNIAESWPHEFMHSYATQMLLLDPHEPGLGPVTLLGLVLRIFENLASQAAVFMELVSHLWISDIWFSPLVVLPLLAFGIGIYRRLITGVPLVEFYTLAYLAIVVLWPFNEGPRFLLAVFPLILLYGYEGARYLCHCAASNPQLWIRRARVLCALLLLGAVFDSFQDGGKLGRQAQAALIFWALGGAITTIPPNRWSGFQHPPKPFFAAAMAFLVLASVVQGSYRIVPLARENRAGSPAALSNSATIEAAAWLEERTDLSEAIMAGQEAVVYYLTGRRGVSFPVTSDAAILKAVIDAHQVRFMVVLDDTPHPYFRPTELERFRALESEYPGHTRIVHRAVGYRIAEVSDDTQAPTQ